MSLLPLTAPWLRRRGTCSSSSTTQACRRSPPSCTSELLVRMRVMTLRRPTIWALAAAGAVGAGLALMMVHGGAEGRVEPPPNVVAATTDTPRASVFMDERRQ